jgi:cohesin loading factor subunit SCC2
MLGEDLAKAMKQCARQLEDVGGDESPGPKLLSYSIKLKESLQDLWKERAVDVFDAG